MVKESLAIYKLTSLSKDVFGVYIRFEVCWCGCASLLSLVCCFVLLVWLSSFETERVIDIFAEVRARRLTIFVTTQV